MSDSANSFVCSETGRRFDSEEAARASETRFREIQAACDAGDTPLLHPGDVIYMDSVMYLSHGVDDFRGGLAEVAEISAGVSASKPATFIMIVQDLDTWHNWHYLAPRQKYLREQHGKDWSHPDPDTRPEFNEP